MLFTQEPKHHCQMSGDTLRRHIPRARDYRREVFTLPFRDVVLENTWRGLNKIIKIVRFAIVDMNRLVWKMTLLAQNTNIIQNCCIMTESIFNFGIVIRTDKAYHILFRLNHRHNRDGNHSVSPIECIHRYLGTWTSSRLFCTGDLKQRHIAIGKSYEIHT